MRGLNWSPKPLDELMSSKHGDGIRVPDSEKRGDIRYPADDFTGRSIYLGHSGKRKEAKRPGLRVGTVEQFTYARVVCIHFQIAKRCMRINNVSRFAGTNRYTARKRDQTQ